MWWHKSAIALPWEQAVLKNNKFQHNFDTFSTLGDVKVKIYTIFTITNIQTGVRICNHKLAVPFEDHWCCRGVIKRLDKVNALPNQEINKIT